MARSTASRRYLIRTFVATVVYLVSVFLALHVFHHGRMALPGALALAAFPSVPIVAIIAIVGLYLREEKDEFQREIFIQALLWAAGITLAVTSFWSFVHLFTRFPPVDGFHVFALFWIAFGIAAIPVRRYYAGGSDD